MRWSVVVGAVAVGWTLACGSGGSDEGPRKPDKEKPDRGKRKGGKSPKPKPTPKPPAEAGPAPCLEGLVGVLVGMPFFDSGEGGQHEKHPGPVTTRTRPRAEAPVAHVFHEDRIVDADGSAACTPGPCRGVNFTYEGQGLPVYGKRKGWVQVGLTQEAFPFEPGAVCTREWVQLEKPLTVLEVGPLVTDRGLTHMLHTWDGTVASEPGGELRPGGLPDGAQFKGEGSKEVDGTLWIDAQFVDQHCGPANPTSRAWVPVMSAEDHLQVWFWTDC